MIRGYKYRLYPNDKQIELLNQTFGCTRFIWNQLVNNFNQYGSIDFKPRFSEKEIKEQNGFLNDTISYALQQKRIDFEKTKIQFFNKKRKVKLGRMKFKKKGCSRDSFRIPGQSIGFNSGINFESKTIRVPKIGFIKFRLDREFSGDLLSITFSKSNTGKYFASVLVQSDNLVLSRDNTQLRSCGIDLGIKDLMTITFGEHSVKIHNPKHFRENQSELARQQRHLSRKTKGSNRYNKQKLRVARVHELIANHRSNFTHKITSLLTDTFDVICLENLDVSKMKTTMGKAISDANLSELVRQIKYKSEFKGTTVTQVDRYFPSSKACSSCGLVNHNLTLAVREWVCECGAVHDRDGNASINIQREGLAQLNNISVETTDYNRGDLSLLKAFNSFNEISNKRLENY